MKKFMMAFVCVTLSAILVLAIRANMYSNHVYVVKWKVPEWRTEVAEDGGKVSEEYLRDMEFKNRVSNDH